MEVDSPPVVFHLIEMTPKYIFIAQIRDILKKLLQEISFENKVRLFDESSITWNFVIFAQRIFM